MRGRTLSHRGLTRHRSRDIAMAPPPTARTSSSRRRPRAATKLPGTIHTAAADVERAGGKASRSRPTSATRRKLRRTIAAAVERFGAIDILVNNASGDQSHGTLATPDEALRSHCTRSTCAEPTSARRRPCRISKNRPTSRSQHSPPLDSNLSPKGFAPHVAYTMSKYGMSLCVLGMAEEFVRRASRSTRLCRAPPSIRGDPIDRRRGRAHEGPKSAVMGDSRQLDRSRRPARTVTGRFFLTVTSCAGRRDGFVRLTAGG